MKRKIRVVGADGKTSEGEIEVRNLQHFEVQLNSRSHIFKPLKGKGSFTRKPKHRKLEDF